MLPPSPGWRTRSIPAPPSSPMPGPGAALPSAPVFAAEPIYNSLPGVPALQLPLSPNLNPGLPPLPFRRPVPRNHRPRCLPSSRCRAGNERADSGRRRTVRREGRTGRAGRTRSAVWRNSSLRQHPPLRAASRARPISRRSHLRLAALMSFVPSFAPERGATPAGPAGRRPGSAYAGTDRRLVVLRPRRFPASRRATPFAYQASVLDLTALPYQHRDDAWRAGTRHLRRARIRRRTSSGATSRSSQERVQRQARSSGSTTPRPRRSRSA